VRHRIEALRAAENDDASRAAALEQDVGQTNSNDLTPAPAGGMASHVDPWACRFGVALIIRTTMRPDPQSAGARLRANTPLMLRISDQMNHQTAQPHR